MSIQGLTRTVIYSQLVAAVKKDHDIMLPNKAGPAVAQLIADVVTQIGAMLDAKDWDGVIRDEDLCISSFSTSGNSWGANELGIHITHRPTGISAAWGTELSQHNNRANAMELLEIKLRKHST